MGTHTHTMKTPLLLITLTVIGIGAISGTGAGAISGSGSGSGSGSVFLDFPMLFVAYTCAEIKAAYADSSCCYQTNNTAFTNHSQCVTYKSTYKSQNCCRRRRYGTPINAPTSEPTNAPTATDLSHQMTLGNCRGGSNAPGLSTVWDCRYDNTDEAGCRAACDAASWCGAFDLMTGSSSSECCLFRAGNTGDGHGTYGRTCWLKPE